MTKQVLFALTALTGVGFVACSVRNTSQEIPTPHIVTVIITPLPQATLFPIETPFSTSTPLSPEIAIFTPTPLLGDTSTPRPSATPTGCGLRPTDAYARIAIGDWMLNQRTVGMLAYAQLLYQGPNDFLQAVTQGSYTASVDASFGTHDGGGAVDLSVYNQGPQAGLLTDSQIEHTIQVLRQAGFAAWYRATGDLYAGSPPHIHAIAIADAELSPAAREQLDGSGGYFRGRNGLPDPQNAADRHGGPIVCPWMIEMGYSDLTANE